MGRLLDGNLSRGFRKWVAINKICDYDFWLMPVHLSGHWVLTIVDFKRKFIIYFDTMHCEPPKNLVQKVISFIDAYVFEQKKLHIDWQKWTLHAPIDTPNQCEGSSGRGNCGVHVCMWGYIFTNKVNIRFLEKEMDLARKGIANIIKNFKKYSDTIEEDIRITLRNEVLDGTGGIFRDLRKNIRLLRAPPLGFRSTMEYFTFNQ